MNLSLDLTLDPTLDLYLDLKLDLDLNLNPNKYHSVPTVKKILYVIFVGTQSTELIFSVTEIAKHGLWEALWTNETASV